MLLFYYWRLCSTFGSCLKLSCLIDMHFNWCRESWLKFTLAPRVKYLGLKFKPVSMFKLYMLLQKCLFMISISYAITESVYFHGCVCHIQNPYANWNSIVGKGNLWCLVWAKSEIIRFVFSDFWNNHAIWAVQSCSTGPWWEIISHILSTLCWIFIWS